MEKNIRELKIVFASDGKGRFTPKISIPKIWLDEMGINPNNREVKVEFSKDEKKIIIKKIKQD